MKRALISITLAALLGTSVHAASVPWRLYYGIREGWRVGQSAVRPAIGTPAMVVASSRRTETGSTPTSIRVLLFEGAGPVHIGVPQGGWLRTGSARIRVPVLSTLRLAASGGKTIVTGPGKRVLATMSPIEVEPAGQETASERIGAPQEGVGNQIFAVEGRLYRGTLSVRPGPANQVELVDDVALEEYLYGVVPRELNADTLEAVKAQAVVSRTYALSHLQPGQPYDVVSDIRAQAYGGLAVESVKTRQAIDETQGQVLSYHGQLAREVCYHASCGGQTAANEDVFGTRPVPYLRSVSCGPTDLEEKAADAVGTAATAYCSCSPYYHWTVQWSRGKLEDSLRRVLKVPASAGAVTGVKPSAWSSDGRVQRLEVRFKRATRSLSGDTIRHALAFTETGGKRHDLYSTWFTLTRDEGTGTYTAVGRGWGHGVGMCQWGAIGMARDGHAYDEILQHYFPGTELTELRPGRLVVRGSLARH